MKIPLLLFLFASLNPLVVFSQDIDFITKKYFQAIGGKSRIDTIQNYAVDYSGTIDGEKFSGIYINARPYWFRYEVRNDSTHTVTCVGYDGKDGWMSNTRLGKDPFKPHERFPAARNRGLHSQNFMNYFIDATQNGYVMHTMGLRKVDTTTCYCLKLLNAERDMEVECFFDALTFMLKKEVHSNLSVSAIDPKKIVEEIHYLEYTSYGGIKLPFRVRRVSITSRSRMVVENTYSNYRFNQPLDPETFRCKL